MSKQVFKVVRLFTALFILFAQLSLPVTGLKPALAAPIMVIDDEGADDEPGQKDLNFLTVDYNPPTAGTIPVTWGWDDNVWTGNNTGDACTLFDTDADGFANYSLCITVDQNGAYLATRLYTCTADSRSDRCGGPALVPAFASTGSAAILQMDPFGTIGRTNNDCDEPTGDTGCLTYDTVASLTVQLSDVGGGSAKLINVCSYPSQEPNSDPSDCVITPNAGFLTIVKDAGSNTTEQFTFTGSPASASGLTSWTITGSGSVQLISYLATTALSLSENDSTAWDLTGASCYIQTLIPTQTGTLSGYTVSGIEIRSGMETICTFTNQPSAAKITLNKTVLNNDGGTAVAADFQAKIGDTLVPWGTENSVTAGTYALSETGPSGYSASAWTCTGGTLDGASLTIGAGQSATCSITNDDVAPTLKLVKNVTNNSGGAKVADDWTLAAAAATPWDARNFSNLGGSGTFQTVFAGAGYALSESSLAGYTAGLWSCNGGSLTGSTVTLALGQNVTCTITNDDQPATLIVKKVVVNDNGGTLKIENFSFQVNGGNAVAFEADGQNDLTVPAGTYTVTEPAVPGYTTSYNNCSNLVIPNGGTATCTITNNDQAATLIVIKHVINDDGGNNTAADFTLDSGGVNDSPENFAGAENPGTTVTLNAGSYNVTESGPAGYTASFSADCTGAIANGQTKTCTVTNNDVAPTLKLVKLVDNSDGGNAVPNEWTLSAVAAAPYDTRNISTLGGAGDFTSVFANQPYTLSETSLAGYTAGTWSCNGGALKDGKITLSEGQTDITCTITNNDVAPTLTLVKNVINDNGGMAQPDDFALVSRHGTDPVFPMLSGVAYPVKANTPYAINETQQPGYAFVSITGSPKCPAALGGTVTLDEGENITCTITNDDISPTLTVTKVLVPSTDTGKFNLLIDGTTQAANVGNAGTTGAVALHTGAHTISETAGTGTYLADYVTTISGDCAANGTVSLALAENKSCTITNTRRGAIVIVKNTLGGNGTFDFTSPTLGNFSLTTSGGTASTTFSGLVPGTYAVAETAPTGWDLTSATCSDGSPVSAIAVQAGETVTCTFTNTKLATINITKDAVPDDAQDFSFTATENTTTTIPDFALDDDADATLPKTITFSFLKPGHYTFTETAVAGWDANGIECHWMPNSGTRVSLDLLPATAAIDLAAGDNVTCTFTNTKRGKIIIDKVTAPAGDTQSFSFDASGMDYADFSLTDAAAPNEQEVRPGTYSVSEAAVPGWDLTGVTCDQGETIDSIDVGPGETVTCTFTNTKRGHIIVDKVTVPAGDPQSFSFDANGGTTPAYTDFSLTDAAAPNNQELKPGTYSVAETVPTDWDLTGATCSDGSPVSAIAVQAGETVTCIFTNTKRGSITIVKDALPNNAQDFNFTSTTSTDTPIGSFALDDDADATLPNSRTFSKLKTGTYSVAEAAVPGWDQTGATCSDGSPLTAISLQAGENITCTFTNTKRGKIIVIKQTEPDGSKASFTFDPSWSTTDFTLKDGESYISPLLVPGAYSVSEKSQLFWTLKSATCDQGETINSIDVGPGETVTCTFTNKQLYWAFTPGFWKNHTSDLSVDPSGHDAWKYTQWGSDGTNVKLGTVFGTANLTDSPKGSTKPFSEYTLLQALSFKGGTGLSGAKQILLRAAVAAVLNASFHETLNVPEHPKASIINGVLYKPGTNEVYYPMSVAKIVAEVNTALATKDPAKILDLAGILDGYNNGEHYIDWSWPAP